MIDATAPGWGWNEGGIELVTVLVHELGHVLGLEHDDATMAPILAPGERRLRVAAPAPKPAPKPTLSSADSRAGKISARGRWQPTRLRAHRLAPFRQR